MSIHVCIFLFFFYIFYFTSFNHSFLSSQLPPINPSAVVSNVPIQWVEILIEQAEFKYCEADEEFGRFIGKAKRSSQKKNDASPRRR